MTTDQDASATPVVVAGLHGRPDDRMVVRWAVHDAETRGARLRIVYAFETPVRYFAIGAAATSLRTAPDQNPHLQEAEAMVAGAVEDARANAADGLAVEGAAVEGSATRVLVAESKRADVVILGSTNHGDTSFLGSVTAATAARAECPVLVVRDASDGAESAAGESQHPSPSGPGAAGPGASGPGAAGPIVAGVDGGPLSEEVLRVGFDYARRYQLGLRAVLFWRSTPERTQRWLTSSGSGEHDAAAQRLSETLDGWSERYPDVEVTQQVRQRPATDGIVEEALGASLLVVGAHGRHALLDRVLGSVSQGVLHRATCPVAVVHRSSRRRPADSTPATDDRSRTD